MVHQLYRGAVGLSARGRAAAAAPTGLAGLAGCDKSCGGISLPAPALHPPRGGGPDPARANADGDDATATERLHRFARRPRLRREPGRGPRQPLTHKLTRRPHHLLPYRIACRSRLALPRSRGGFAHRPRRTLAELVPLPQVMTTEMSPHHWRHPPLCAGRRTDAFDVPYLCTLTTEMLSMRVGVGVFTARVSQESQADYVRLRESESGPQVVCVSVHDAGLPC